MQTNCLNLISSPSTKSILSSESSVNIKFECEEDISSVLLPSRDYFEVDLSPNSKKTGSIKVNNMLNISNFEYFPLEIEDDFISPTTSWRPVQQSNFISMAEKELEYMPNPYAFETIQQEINKNMRRILYDWIIEVCAEFSLKRETCYLALNYMDRVVSSFGKIKKAEFQLFGLASMFIASKVEEIYPPKLQDWVKSADGGYSKSQIIHTERMILSLLSFKTMPTTVYNWVNWLMTQWDSFIDYHFGCVQYNKLKDFAHLEKAEKEIQQKLYEKRRITFKEANQRAYKRFRETMQVLDVTVLKIESIKFLPRVLAGGLIYLMISKYFYETNYCLLYYNGPDYDESLKNNRNDYLNTLFGEANDVMQIDEEITESQHIEGATVVQELYSGFLAAALEIKNIEEIYSTVSFLHPFLELDILFDLPAVCKTVSKARIESHYEEFLSYQTHNHHNLEFVARL